MMRSIVALAGGRTAVDPRHAGAGCKTPFWGRRTAMASTPISPATT